MAISDSSLLKKWFIQPEQQNNSLLSSTCLFHLIWLSQQVPSKVRKNKFIILNVEATWIRFPVPIKIKFTEVYRSQ